MSVTRKLSPKIKHETRGSENEIKLGEVIWQLALFIAINLIVCSCVSTGFLFRAEMNVLTKVYFL